MPRYEYKCPACKGVFEVEQKITDEKLKRCQMCQSPDIRRLISKTSFSLKGGNWGNKGYGS